MLSKNKLFASCFLFSSLFFSFQQNRTALGIEEVAGAASPCVTEPKEIKLKYALGPDQSKHWERTVALPTSGKFVQEAHYVTTQDTFAHGNLFAHTVEENIQRHLKRSFQLYRKFDSTAVFDSLYNNPWKTKWTPAERGYIGQGAVGSVQVQELQPEMELWMMNMMWAPGERPARGTKFLLSANRKQVVVIAGYETGPGSQHYLGGVTCEVHAWLGTDSNAELQIAYLKDQSIPAGPIDCQALR